MELVPKNRSSAVRAVLELAVILGIVAIAWFAYPQQSRTVVSQAYQHFFPCRAPVTYQIGSIDPRFGLSRPEVAALLQNAVSKWNDAAGKTVLAYDPAHGVVVVNFVYDYRQNATNEMNSIGASVDNGTARYDALKSQYASRQKQYLSDKSAFDAAVANYQNQQTTYNAEVTEWNARGGTPSSTYGQLQSQGAALQAKAVQLQSQQSSQSAEADSLNALAGEINQLISSLNLKVDKYNEIGASTGSEFEQGLFESSFGNETIDIYEYDSALHLHRVIAHEFGHALGLEHVSDGQAIMNALNDGSTEQLTAADITALDQVCHL